MTPAVINGAGEADVAATLVGAALLPTGWNIPSTDAPHNFGQEIAAVISESAQQLVAMQRAWGPKANSAGAMMTLTERSRTTANGHTSGSH